MTGTTLRVIVDDLMKDFKQQFDDKQLQKSQIAHWVIMIGNRLLSQHIGKRDSGAFLSIYAGVPIEVSATTTNPNDIQGRKHIILPTSIFDYNKDGGVEYISYYNDKAEPGCPPPFTRQTFTRTTPSDVSRLYMSGFEKPDPKNPYWYRAGNYIYLLGIECINPKEIEIGIYSTIKPINDPDTDLDKVFNFPEELIIQLKKQVLDLGRFVMVIPEERINDGIDSEQQKPIPMNKLTSVNEMSEDVTENK
jgi:hypothetical protein